MKQSSKLSILLVTLLLLGSLYFSTEIGNPAIATGSIDASVEAGDTYWYNVSSFPSYNQLIDLSNPGFDENNSVSMTGGLEGSMIYVKVIDKNTENMTYWDGANEVTELIPTVDLATGLITGQDLSIEVIADGNTSTAIIPSGTALPLPLIFGTVTMFNVSSATNMFLPVPLVLNDQFDLHETIVNQFAAQMGAGSILVTSDTSQFRIDATNIEVDTNGTTLLNGFVSYQKPSGLLQEINFDVYNTTTATTIVDIDIDLVKAGHVPLNLNVGDTFEIMIDHADFDYTTDGDASDPTTVDGIQSTQDKMRQSIGQRLLEFEVVDIDGLYYSIQGSMANGTEPRIPIPSYENGYDDHWFVGFGRYGLGMPTPNADPSVTEVETINNVYNDTGHFQYSYSVWEAVPLRERTLAGPIVTPDFEIYTAWDKTMSFVMELTQESGIFALETLENLYDLRAYSSTSDEPSIIASFTGGVAGDGTYGWNMNFDVDVGVWYNNTYVETYTNYTDYSTYNETFTEITEVNFIGYMDMNLGYNERGVLQSLDMVGGYSIEITTWNATHQTSWGELNITNFGVSLSTQYTPITPTTTSSTTSSGTTSDTTSDTSTGTGSDTTTSDDGTGTRTTSTDDDSRTTTTTSDDDGTSSTTTTTTDDDSSSATTTSDDSETNSSVTPDVDLPGFELVYTLVSIFSVVGIITRFRKS